MKGDLICWDSCVLMGDLGVVRKILVDEESTKPTIIPFPYGGKRYNDWVSS